VACARPKNNIAAVSARSGDGSLRLRMSSFDSIVMRARESTPHGSQRQAVQDSEPGAMQHRISERPVLARGRAQALSVRTRRFASSFALADTCHSIAGREDRILEGWVPQRSGDRSRRPVLPVGRRGQLGCRAAEGDGVRGRADVAGGAGAMAAPPAGGGCASPCSGREPSARLSPRPAAAGAESPSIR
jgi:hypothetical protein